MGAETVSHAAILDAVNGLAETIGGEQLHPDTGQVIATGVFARLRAIEGRDQQEELNRLRWKSRILGVTATAGFFGAVVMWIAGDRIDNTKELVRNPPAAEGKK